MQQQTNPQVDDDRLDARMEPGFGQAQENTEDEPDMETKLEAAPEPENKFEVKDEALQEKADNHPLELYTSNFKLKGIVGSERVSVNIVDTENWNVAVQGLVDAKEAEVVSEAIKDGDDEGAVEKEMSVKEKIEEEMKQLSEVVEEFKDKTVIVQPDSANKTDHLSQLDVDQCFLATSAALEGIKQKLADLENFEIEDIGGVEGSRGFKIKANVSDGVKALALAFLVGKEKGEMNEEEVAEAKADDQEAA